MKLNDKQKLEFYQNYIDVFEIPIIKNIVKKIIVNTPTIFFGASTSSSGKYHPIATNGEMGLVKHSIAVMLTAIDFMRNETIINVFDLENISQEEKEIILAACLLHDNAKYGVKDNIEKKKKYLHYKSIQG